MIKPLRIGTRKSKLALWQAQRVQQLLEQQGLPADLHPIETKGDKVLDVALHKVGSKGLFTEELDELLRQEEIDLAVHSAKDVQSRLTEDMELIAFTQREYAGDILLANRPLSLQQAHEQGLVIGSSSTRRQALLRKYYPQVQIRDIRGNLQTRLRKMQEEDYDGILLAYAGVKRMGYEELVQEKLALDVFTPAVGQGSMAIQTSIDLEDDLREGIIKACNHRTTAICLRLEREFLATLEGGCSVPVYGLAELHGEKLYFRGGIIDLDGHEELTEEIVCSPTETAGKGKLAAQRLLERGGDQLLAQIKDQLKGH